MGNVCSIVIQYRSWKVSDAVEIEVCIREAIMCTAIDGTPHLPREFAETIVMGIVIFGKDMRKRASSGTARA